MGKSVEVNRDVLSSILGNCRRAKLQFHPSFFFLFLYRARIMFFIFSAISQRLQRKGRQASGGGDVCTPSLPCFFQFFICDFVLEMLPKIAEAVANKWAERCLMEGSGNVCEV